MRELVQLVMALHEAGVVADIELSVVQDYDEQALRATAQIYSTGQRFTAERLLPDVSLTRLLQDLFEEITK